MRNFAIIKIEDHKFHIYFDDKKEGESDSYIEALAFICKEIVESSPLGYQIKFDNNGNILNINNINPHKYYNEYIDRHGKFDFSNEDEEEDIYMEKTISESRFEELVGGQFQLIQKSMDHLIEMNNKLYQLIIDHDKVKIAKIEADKFKWESTFRHLNKHGGLDKFLTQLAGIAEDYFKTSKIEIPKTEI